MSTLVLKWVAAAVAIIGLAVLAGLYSPTLSGQSYRVGGGADAVSSACLVPYALQPGQPVNSCLIGAQLHTSTNVVNLTTAQIPCSAATGKATVLLKTKTGTSRVPVLITAADRNCALGQ